MKTVHQKKMLLQYYCNSIFYVIYDDYLATCEPLPEDIEPEGINLELDNEQSGTDDDLIEEKIPKFIL